MGQTSLYARMGRLSAIIMILPAGMAAGWILGYYLIDRALESFPWGSLIMVLLGAGVGFYEIFGILMQDRGDRTQGQSR